MSTLLVGKIVAVALTIMGLVRVWRFYLGPHLPEKLRWETAHPLVRLALVVVLPGMTAFLQALLTGDGWETAIESAISTLVASLGAMGANAATETLGKVETVAKLKLDPDYQPGKLRRTVDVIVPLDRSMLNGGPDARHN